MTPWRALCLWLREVVRGDPNRRALREAQRAIDRQSGLSAKALEDGLDHLFSPKRGG